MKKEKETKDGKEEKVSLGKRIMGKFDKSLISGPVSYFLLYYSNN